ncbi:hypothetical protein [Lacipirellula limnantheis]|nr:hypothetical protein [Lacipirellula limnantheis]
MDRQSAGVTHENNGAVNFWQAMGPVGVNDEDFKLICDALDVDPQSCLSRYDGPRTDAFKQRLTDWLKTKDTSLSSASAAILSQQIVVAISEGRLSASNVTPAVAWLKANEERLDSLVECSMRPRFYSPTPTFLKDRSSEVSRAQLQDAEQLRSAAAALAMRANWRLSSNDPAGAWRDTLAVWRLGSHASRGWTIVNSLVGIAIRNHAGLATLAIIQSPNVPVSVLKQIQGDLSTIDQSVDLTEAISFGERCLALDMTLRLFWERPGGLNVEDADALNKIASLTFDEAIALGAINQWCDRLAAAANEINCQPRLSIRKKLIDELSRLATITMNIPDLQQRSQAVGNALAYYSIGLLNAAFKAHGRDEVRFRILRVAVELAIHRSQAAEYPMTLDELAINDSTLLDDPYSDGRLVYHRNKEGYILYSLFENGVDDGGSDAFHPIVEGEWIAPDDDPYFRDVDKSDLVIRLPLPAFEPLSPKDVADVSH